ncbi:PepSY domain-containing protein [Colwellia sp. MT41]|uniref:PepSY domain-containing protein n=1 Tax=Colwellia sp. MT41 TaxID=58049 RepID=UPI000AB1795D|nr:PepSY domain-containing protein [Colwellia sp. MT41]
MTLHRNSRKYHKWLMLFVGLQFIVWSASGTYMVLMDIDYIHGDSFVAAKKQSLKPEQVQYSFRQLLAEHAQAKNIELGFMLKQAVYRFSLNKEKVIISAKDGQQLSPINKSLATEIAKQNYAHKNAVISSVQLITAEPPRELSARHLPVWRIDFDHFASPSFYISANSAQLVTKRHSFWRIFDWMFAFHVMDYIDESPDNKLLLIVSVLAFLASIFGLVLTYYRLAPAQNKRNKGKSRRIKLSRLGGGAANEKT